jgi:hypothetical protein
MAINVNTVYTTVLSIINKEQRGYLTPDEFNKLSTQVQLEIFEKFFEDYNQFLRMPKTDVEFASRMDHIMEEFQIFEKNEDAFSTTATGVYTQPTDLHRFGTASYTKGLQSPILEIVGSRDYKQQILSPLTQPNTNFPIAKYQGDKITPFPSVTSFNPPLVPDKSDINFNYIRKPGDVRWGYTVGSLGQYIYDSRPFIATSLGLGNITSSTNFNSASATAGTYIVSQGAGASDAVYTAAAGNSGTGAKFSILVASTGALSSTTASIEVTESGSKDFGVGDTFVIAAGAFGGLTASITITLTAVNLMSATGQGSLQFEISESQQTDAVLGVLKYAGIIIKDTMVIQAAGGLQNLDEQNSKK